MARFEYCEMVIIYGEWQRNATHAAQEYILFVSQLGQIQVTVTIINVSGRQGTLEVVNTLADQ